MTTSPPHPLYNTTYTLHRLSPLHSFPSTTTTTTSSSSSPHRDLKHHAKSLLNLLRGDVLRGVRINNNNDEEEEEDGLGRAGRLKAVVWSFLPTFWRRGGGEDEGEGGDGDGEDIGVKIEIIYEKITYTSLLFRPIPPSPPPPPPPPPAGGGGGGGGGGGFTNLPLLLTRLPKRLRSCVVGYLETSFDTLLQPLVLESKVLKACLEGFLEVVDGGGDDDDDDAVEGEEGGGGGGGGGKDIQLTFSPPFSTDAAAAGLLKTISITIPREDISGFYTRGKKLVSKPNSSSSSSSGRGRGGEGEGPFFEALALYAMETMGIDIPALPLMKVACGGFVLGGGGGSAGGGKVKIFTPRRRGRRREERVVERVLSALVGVAEEGVAGRRR